MSAENWQQLKSIFNAALELAPSERAAFVNNSCNGDDALRNQVNQLLASHEEVNDFLASPAIVDAGLVNTLPYGASEPPPTRVGEKIGPYEIIREIGHGGMGTVFLAVRADDQYRKEVAIKLVNRGMDTDLILRRFMMERQILANLEHSYIARLLDGGSTADGLPYFVMEYIEGQPITEYCEARQLTNTERLELFRKVCDALQYAHQNLIVHRDIKPSNVLVTAEGEPKLLDFGIAKLLGPGWSNATSEATASMVRLMTPEYASPEQLRGLTITTASDVYSLGVVLYELLTGRHPYRVHSRQPAEIARAALSEEPERPSIVASRQQEHTDATDQGQRTSENQLDAKRSPHSTIRNPKSLRGDLDNIVLKALRKEPERRYASVQEFSADIRRHLEGLPVTASPDTLAYRSRKFIQRNKAAALAATVVLITLLSATAITAWQARMARRERDNAQQRFRQVRKLANTVIFDYHDAIEKLPGSTPVREKMVKDALEYLDNLSLESRGDPTLQFELASAYEKVGDVQGNPYLANLGDSEGALASYRKALTIRQSLLSANQSNQSLRDLAKTNVSIADVLWSKGEIKQSVASYESAVALFEQASKSEPLNPAVRYDLARGVSRLAVARGQDNDYSGAAALWEKAIKSANELLASEPNNLKYQRLVAICYTNLGGLQYAQHDYNGALSNFQKSSLFFEEQSKADPNDARKRRDLAIARARLGLGQVETGNYENAVKTYQQVIVLQRELLNLDPNNLQNKIDLAASHTNLGDTFHRMGKLDQAFENINLAISLLNESLAKDPHYGQLQSYLGAVHLTLGDTHVKKGDLAQAVASYEKARSFYESGVARSSSAAELATVYQKLGDTYFALAGKAGSDPAARNEHAQAAHDWFDRSLAAWKTLKDKNSLRLDEQKKPDELTEKLARCNAELAKLAQAR